MSDPRYIYVPPYYRADGTLVSGYRRRKPTPAKAKKDNGDGGILKVLLALLGIAAVIGPHLPPA